MRIEIHGLEIDLLKDKALWIPSQKTLVIGDLHFGKVNHFRRAGLPAPFGAVRKNAEKLVELINSRKPQTILFLGDLFHSHYNDEWEEVGQIIRHFSAIKFRLIRGNHDILSERQYDRYGIEVSAFVQSGPFYFTHEPMEEIPGDLFNIAGHIHPGARLLGRGRQAVTLPCFWLRRHQMVLPAFGSFTGMAIVHPEENDRVFVVLEDKLIEATLAGESNLES